MRRLLLAAALAVGCGVAFVGPAAAVDDQNCSDFPSQAAAQQHLREDPSDPDNLDGNNDGVACEDNPAPYDTVPVPQATTGTTAPAPPTPTTAPPSMLVSADGSIRAEIVRPAAPSQLPAMGPSAGTVVGFLGAALVLAGMRMRGRRAAGEHWLP